MSEAVQLLVIILLVIVLPVVLQLLICGKTGKTKSKMGLVLPAISLVFSVFLVMNTAVMNHRNMLVSTVLMLLVTNIPTVVLYVIYRVYAKRNQQTPRAGKNEAEGFVILFRKQKESALILISILIATLRRIFFRPAVSVSLNTAFATPSVSFLAGRKKPRRFGCNQVLHQY